MKNKSEDNAAVLFKKLIKDTIEEEGYFKEKDIKQLMTNILNEIDFLIAKRVKKHFYDIGLYIVKNDNSSTNMNESKISGDKKDAQTS
jgi:hypothetical protein